MYRLDRFRRTKNYLKYVMPFARIIDDPPIVVTKDGGLQVTWKYRGPDIDSAIQERMEIITSQMNAAFMTLGTGWVLYFEAQRIPSFTYDDDVFFPDQVTKTIDNHRKAAFLVGNYFESNYYMTMYWRVPDDTEGRIKNFMIEGKSQRLLTSEDNIAAFKEVTEKINKIFISLSVPAEYLTKDELVTYLHSTVSDNITQQHMPGYPMLLDQYLYDTPLYGGLAPRLGEKHLRVITPMTFLPYSQFGIFDRLNRISFSYRWVTRYVCMDKQDALKELKNYQSGWRNKVVTLKSLFQEFLSSNPNTDIDEVALMKADEVKAAINAVEADELNFGFYTTAIIVMDEDMDQADEKAKYIVQTFSGLNMKSKIEDINSVDAWLGTIPGALGHNCRKPMMSTANLAHMLPISDIWAGPRRNDHLKAPCLIYTQTTGNTPFRLSLHVGSVGHTFIVGPTGAGKSVLLNMMEASFRKYRDAKVFVFDKGASSRVLTEAVGGVFYDLGAETETLSFQPLSQIESPEECQWVLGWLCDWAVSRGEKIDATKQKSIWDTLCLLQELPTRFRSMTNFIDKLQDSQLKDVFMPLSIRGPYGKIFDSLEDNLSFGSWQSFEMSKMIEENSAVISPTLMYIFHRIQQSIADGHAPTLIVLDECWAFFRNPVFEAKIRSWLKELRKYNASVVFATQSISDISECSIFPTVLESCMSKIYLPNKDIYNPTLINLYESFGLNRKQIDIIAHAQQHCDYYYTSIVGSRLFDLVLDDYTKAFVAATDKKDVQMCNQIISQYGHEAFLEQWLKYKNL